MTAQRSRRRDTTSRHNSTKSQETKRDLGDHWRSRRSRFGRSEAVQRSDQGLRGTARRSRRQGGPACHPSFCHKGFRAASLSWAQPSGHRSAVVGAPSASASVLHCATGGCPDRHGPCPPTLALRRPPHPPSTTWKSSSRRRSPAMASGRSAGCRHGPMACDRPATLMIDRDLHDDDGGTFGVCELHGEPALQWHRATGH